MGNRPSTHPDQGTQHPLIERALITAGAVAVSVLITALFSLAFHGTVGSDFVITGFSCSLVVSWLVVGRLQAMRRSLAQALDRERALEVRAEKIRTLQQTMSKVQHHVNNLAENLQVVEFQYETTGALSAPTLATLRNAIAETAHEMRTLGELEDPFDDRAFEIRLGKAARRVKASS
jgi:hypothetical protein